MQNSTQKMKKIGNALFIREKMLTIFGWNFEIEERCKGVHCLELSNEYLLAKIGVDTAENEPLEVWGENSIHYSLHSFVFIQLLVPGFRKASIVPIVQALFSGTAPGSPAGGRPARSGGSRSRARGATPPTSLEGKDANELMAWKMNKYGFGNSDSVIYSDV